MPWQAGRLSSSCSSTWRLRVLRAECGHDMLCHGINTGRRAQGGGVEGDAADAPVGAGGRDPAGAGCQPVPMPAGHSATCKPCILLLS